MKKVRTPCLGGADYRVYKEGDKFLVVDELSGRTIKSFGSLVRAVALYMELTGKEGEIHILGPQKYFHLTKKDLGPEAVLEPSWSDSMVDVFSPKGVSFSPTIEQCFAALPMGDFMRQVATAYVYTPVEETEVIAPITEDIEISEEKKALEPVRAKRLGRVRKTGQSYKGGIRWKWLEREE